MKMPKKILTIVGAAFIGLVATILFRTLAYSSKQESVPPVPRVAIDEDRAVEHLSRGIQIRTVTYDDPSQVDRSNLIALREYIDAEYPLIHERLERTIINDYSLVYEWTGTRPADQPIILTAHMDVVPAVASEWEREPFSGELIDGVIWGRGALDDKGSLFSILEAVENLLRGGYEPERTVYLAFGHDEEAGTTGGMAGARKIAEYLENSGVHAEFVLDEGSTIIDGNLSPVRQQKFAVVGVAEKGWLSVKITAAGEGGHSSMPGKDTAIELLAKAIVGLKDDRMPSSLNGALGLSLDYFGPEMPFLRKAVFANRWLFQDLIVSELEKSNASAAMLHTTVAPTIIHGGSKEQSLPASASVVINFRIVPGETSQDVLIHVRSTFDDPRITVEQFGSVVHEPSPISRCESESFKVIERTIRETLPEVKVAPGLVTGRTDSLYYRGVADDVFRFAPYLYGPEDLPRVHGANEQIDAAGYLDMIQFYMRLVRNGSKA